MAKTVIPFGDRILCKRHKVGEKLGTSGLIVATDDTAERPTDLATVVHVPDWTMADKVLLNDAKEILANLMVGAKAGDPSAFSAALQFGTYLRLKSVKVGDDIFISKYVGTDFHDTESSDLLTLVSLDDIIGLVKSEEPKIVKPIEKLVVV